MLAYSQLFLPFSQFVVSCPGTGGHMSSPLTISNCDNIGNKWAICPGFFCIKCPDIDWGDQAWGEEEDNVLSKYWLHSLFPSCFCLFGEVDPILRDKKLSLIWVNLNLKAPSLGMGLARSNNRNRSTTLDSKSRTLTLKSTLTRVRDSSLVNNLAVNEYLLLL